MTHQDVSIWWSPASDPEIAVGVVLVLTLGYRVNVFWELERHGPGCEINMARIRLAGASPRNTLPSHVTPQCVEGDLQLRQVPGFSNMEE